jgi:hypothetical protein
MLRALTPSHINELLDLLAINFVHAGSDMRDEQILIASFGNSVLFHVLLDSIRHALGLDVRMRMIKAVLLGLVCIDDDPLASVWFNNDHQIISHVIAMWWALVAE